VALLMRNERLGKGEIGQVLEGVEKGRDASRSLHSFSCSI
jgi:hypothetical protein